MEIDIRVYALPVTKLKILSLLLVKQHLSSGLLIDRSKKSQILRAFADLSEFHSSATVRNIKSTVFWKYISSVLVHGPLF